MESMREIFDGMVNLLIGLEKEGKLSKEQSGRFDYFLSQYGTYYKYNNFWREKK